MDLGVMTLDGLLTSSDPDHKTKWYNGSGLLKQERSGTCTEDELLRTFKLAKTDQNQRNSCTSSPNSSLLRSNVTSTLFSDAQHQQQMLSFSSPNPKSESFSLDKNTPTLSFPYHHQQHHNHHHHNPMSTYNRNTGYGSGGMHGGFNGVRGPFTPSQWMELEHQALIYKYITANVAVPHHLLIPIRKALDSAGLSTFSAALLRPNAYAVGWGGFHLGYSNNTDPEPGRCRRTDGKKWRCSRDAVVDQKYCERHMNRGRHRSRKPVEGQSGQALTTGGTTNTATTNVTSSSTITTPSGPSKQINVAASPSSIVVPGGNNNNNNAANTLSFAHQEHSKNMNSLIGQDNASSAANTINRMFMNSKENNNNSERMQDGSALPMLPPTLELKPKDDNSFMIQKQHIPYDESSRNNEFGFVTSDSLLNPSQKATTLLGTRTFGSSSQNPTNRDTGSQHSLRHFIDDFPKTHSDPHNHHNRSSGFSWPELDMQSDRTQLSISTPLTASDFMSFPSSATNEKLTLSPLRLSREIDPIQMGLGVGNSTLNNNESSNPSTNHPNTRQANWIPITWESSMGGPLGEVLHLSNIACNASDDHYGANNVNNSSALNLMTDGWDNHNSPPMGSSPTGVLQKTAFGSLSNSSAGSSPRAENNKATQEGASLCNDHLGSTLGNNNNNTSFTP